MLQHGTVKQADHVRQRVSYHNFFPPIVINLF